MPLPNLDLIRPLVQHRVGYLEVTLVADFVDGLLVLLADELRILAAGGADGLAATSAVVPISVSFEFAKSALTKLADDLIFLVFLPKVLVKGLGLHREVIETLRSSHVVDLNQPIRLILLNHIEDSSLAGRDGHPHLIDALALGDPTAHTGVWCAVALAHSNYRVVVLRVAEQRLTFQRGIEADGAAARTGLAALRAEREVLGGRLVSR